MTGAITEIDGMWWPTGDDPRVREYLSIEVGIVHHIAGMFGRRRLAVQAGGHVGLYPMVLASYFGKVVTFEPCPTNFACLLKNVASSSAIEPFRGALGVMPAAMRMVQHATNSGAHYMEGHQHGDVPSYTIDGLGLGACDFIMLDVEGMEALVLLGAKETIRKYRPVLYLEDKGESEKYGIMKRGVVTLMAQLYGYRLCGHNPHDVLLVAP